MKVKRLDEFMKKETASTAKQQPTPQYEIVEFYRETEFQETEIGKIPREWRIEKLGNIITYVKGKKPNRLYDEKVSEDFLPYLTAEYMRGLEKPKWCNLREDSKIIKVQSDDIIMIWDGSYSGHVFTGFEGVLASTMVKITSKQNIAKNSYTTILVLITTK